jgi:hypothetical protein
MRGRRKDARRIPFRCGSCTRLSALRLPSFRGGVFWECFLASLFLAWLFLVWAKLGCEGASRQRMDACRKRTFRKRTSGHFQRTGYGAETTHAKLSGAAHTRTVAGAPIARAQRFGPARAVRFAGIVPLLHKETLPPGAHMLRRRPRGVRLEVLVPQEGQAQDAAERMEPARAPQVVVAPRAAKPAPPNPSRRGGRSAISGWSDNSFAAVARRGYFGLSPGRFVPVAPHRARRAFSFPGQRRCLAP